jgi:hypothetical protein
MKIRPNIGKSLEHRLGDRRRHSASANPESAVSRLPIVSTHGDCANVDGPWPRRVDELREECHRLADQGTRMRLAGLSRSGGGRTPGEQFVAGAQDAMRWTLAERANAPLRQDLTVVSDANVGQIATLARRLARTDTPVAAYAAGVVAWLEWLTGDGDHLTYPPA